MAIRHLAASSGDDGVANGDRWVRMSRDGARWIKDKRPIVQIDGDIGQLGFNSRAKRARCNRTFANPTQN